MVSSQRFFLATILSPIVSLLKISPDPCVIVSTDFPWFCGIVYYSLVRGWLEGWVRFRFKMWGHGDGGPFRATPGVWNQLYDTDSKSPGEWLALKMVQMAKAAGNITGWSGLEWPSRLGSYDIMRFWILPREWMDFTLKTDCNLSVSCSWLVVPNFL